MVREDTVIPLAASSWAILFAPNLRAANSLIMPAGSGMAGLPLPRLTPWGAPGVALFCADSPIPASFKG